MEDRNGIFKSKSLVLAEGRLQTRPSADGRARADRNARRAFSIITMLPVLLIAVISVALIWRAWPVVGDQPLSKTIFGVAWRPEEGSFGFWPFITGTAWVTMVGMLLAVFPCIMVSLYLSEYAHAATRSLAKPVLDLLAAIPPVVYGVWGLLAIVPFVEHVLAPFAKRWLGAVPILAVNQPTGFSILAGGIVLAVMVAPFIISVLYEIFATVPDDLRHASLAVGATRWQTIRSVVIPRVLPGIVAGVVLGASRALGETIAVLMVIGNVAKVPSSVFDPAYPLPALIANNYGDMMSIPLYDAALLGAALVLLVVILFFNMASTLVLQQLLGRQWT
jgi:phosphate transport system permease protein